ncbi:hypothetical protein L1987_80545 [Smallanthus sonchifolius]|uniref:Uncharacterized protein n=1 Tax=Smallanthus sonchifolius TaxID=185202 RepID=A0ACB8YN07_9ASTR|nr:hypothetical protein L1987_80545 [Smallanthus sonchifolius]
MMKIDVDGNLRVYSLVEKEWVVQWQAVSHSCRIHGICGQNSVCTYSQDSGRTCTCLHGYKMVNPKDWSNGCEPDFKICRPEDEDFVKLQYVEFFSYDIRYHEGYSLDACKNDCLHDCACKGFQFGYDHETRESSVTIDQIYSPAATPFRKFTYRELKKASCNFRDEIGRGGAGVVYKGRGDIKKSRFSTIRGTRGYMAPEWVFKLRITSKVDVFSYGVVVLEMITGQGPGGKKQRTDENGEAEPGVVEWVRGRARRVNGSGSESWVEDIVNGSVGGEFDLRVKENLVRIALKCAEDDMENRPTMSKVVHMLLHPENDK